MRILNGIDEEAASHVAYMTAIPPLGNEQVYLERKISRKPDYCAMDYTEENSYFPYSISI